MSVSVNCGNKIEFSFGANCAEFAQTVTLKIFQNNNYFIFHKILKYVQYEFKILIFMNSLVFKPGACRPAARVPLVS